MRVVTSLPFVNVTLINPCISSYRKATGYVHPRKRLSRHRLLVSNIL